VRVHASKDYVDMAAMLEQYPDIRATFNLTPSLIRQLDDIATGTKDLYWVHTEIPAEELSDAQKTFLLERFFDTNRKIIARFPRYQELLEMRDEEGIETAVETWASQDFRDLQVLFNLAWTDPAWLAEPPLDSLVEQGRDFDEEDKQIVLDEHLRLVQEVIPLHAELQESGQIEVTMTPFAHPILPLLVDSDLAAVAMPDAELPPRFVYGQDAVAQVKKGIEFYRQHFKADPRGMWPAEGSVAEEIVSMVANAGIEWIATDEDVLAGSLPEIDDFTRDQNDVVQQAETLYQLYRVQGARGGPVAIVFRDKLISDLVGFQYSGMEGQAAADDFISRLEAIQVRLEEQVSTGPHLVTVLLDGENAWEHYDNDGKAFLHGLYANLSENEEIVTVTPAEYLDALAELEGEPEMIEELWPGSWIDGTFSTWIGEDEENLAWEYLKRTRDDLQDVLIDGSLDEQTQADVLETMYIAEGSDWFWWYGADQNSGNDESFDQQYRNYLEQVYTLSGQEVPAFVDVPVIPQSAQPPDQLPQAMLTDVTADGTVGEGEWDGAGYYALDQAGLSQLSYGFDQEHLYLRLDAEERIDQNRVYGFYLNIPGADQANAYTRYGEGETLLGFGVNRLVEISFPEAEPVAQIYSADGQGGWEPFGEQPEPLDQIALGDGVLELVLPFRRFAPDVRSGNQINFRLVVSESQADLAVFPPDGPVLATVPDLPIPNVFLDVSDPQGDDDGPGTYTYPEDAVFKSGAYDITGFTAGRDEEFYIFRVQFRGPVENPWDSPNGLSIQTIDIYIDTDGGTSGDRILLPGRNAALTEGHAWNYAIWAEGWTPGIYQPGEDAPVEMEGGMEIITNPGQRRVTISVPIRLLPEGDPASWGFAVTVLSQEGFPAPGVWRVRDVQPEAEQWRIGGGTGSNLDTRILDVLLPETAEGSQQAYLENPNAGEDVQLEGLPPDQYPQVPVVAP
jgi:alpha-amylase/alpha-mannosidase (GH57 family)